MVIDEGRFPGRQGRLLFAYLVAEQGRAVPRDELAEALWGDAPPATWDKALTVLVSKLRAVLSDGGIDGTGALTGAFGCYRLELPAGSWVDIVEAARAADEAETALSAGGRNKRRPPLRWPRHWSGSRSCPVTTERGLRRSAARSPMSASAH